MGSFMSSNTESSQRGHERRADAVLLGALAGRRMDLPGGGELCVSVNAGSSRARFCERNKGARNTSVVTGSGNARYEPLRLCLVGKITLEDCNRTFAVYRCTESGSVYGREDRENLHLLADSLHDLLCNVGASRRDLRVMNGFFEEKNYKPQIIGTSRFSDTRLGRRRGVPVDRELYIGGKGHQFDQRTGDSSDGFRRTNYTRRSLGAEYRERRNTYVNNKERKDCVKVGTGRGRTGSLVYGSRLGSNGDDEAMNTFGFASVPVNGNLNDDNGHRRRIKNSRGADTQQLESDRRHVQFSSVTIISEKDEHTKGCKSIKNVEYQYPNRHSIFSPTQQKRSDRQPPKRFTDNTTRRTDMKQFGNSSGHFVHSLYGDDENDPDDESQRCIFNDGYYDKPVPPYARVIRQSGLG
nr:myristylated tegument protein CIRC CoAHV1 [Psittacid alphaherpesvirus 6]